MRLEQPQMHKERKGLLVLGTRERSQKDKKFIPECIWETGALYTENINDEFTFGSHHSNRERRGGAQEKNCQGCP